MKKIFLACLLFICAISVQAQLLKKLKDKVNKVVDKTSGTEDSSTSGTSSSSKQEDSKTPWCNEILPSTGTATGGASGGTINGVGYTMAYATSGRMSIIYNESSIGLKNDVKGYRLILSEYVNNRTRYVVVENGKVIDTDNKVKNQYIGKQLSDEVSIGTDGYNRNQEMKKYIVADSTKYEVRKTEASTHTVKKIDEDQMTVAMNIARQTDEYKKMTVEEKAELECTIQEGMKQNNAMAGQTFSAPGQQGGSFAYVNGYFVLVKGKKYGKFMMEPAVEVSDNEMNFFAVGIDEQSNPFVISNGKKTILDKNKYGGVTGKMIRSADNSKCVFIEARKMSNEEMMDYSAGKFKMVYNVLRQDGTSLAVTDYSSTGKFILTNSGSIVTTNESTGEVYADGKKIGTFSMSDGRTLTADALLIGFDISKIAYYDGSSGSINYLDGSVKKMGVMFPKVILENGKSYLTWFSKCGNNIYIARFEY